MDVGFSSRSSRIKAKKRGLLSSGGVNSLDFTADGAGNQSAGRAGKQDEDRAGQKSSVGSQGADSSHGSGAAQGLRGLIESGRAPTMLSLLTAGDKVSRFALS